MYDALRNGSGRGTNRQRVAAFRALLHARDAPDPTVANPEPDLDAPVR